MNRLLTSNLPSMSLASQPRYASHHLRLGRWIAHSVLIEERASGGFLLAPFTAEGERTIFLSGTITLLAPTCSLAEEGLTEAGSLALLQQELDSHEGWTLQLPADDGR